VNQSLRPRRQGWQSDEGLKRQQARSARRSTPPGRTASQPPNLGLRSQHLLLLKVLLGSPVDRNVLLTLRRRRRARRGGGAVDAFDLRDRGQAASGGNDRDAAAAGLVAATHELQSRGGSESSNREIESCR
jgi:hypothetical protein